MGWDYIIIIIIIFFFFFFGGGGGVAKIKKLYACYSLYFFVDNIGCWVQAYVLRKQMRVPHLGWPASRENLFSGSAAKKDSNQNY